MRTWRRMNSVFWHCKKKVFMKLRPRNVPSFTHSEQQFDRIISAWFCGCKVNLRVFSNQTSYILHMMLVLTRSGNSLRNQNRREKLNLMVERFKGFFILDVVILVAFSKCKIIIDAWVVGECRLFGLKHTNLRPFKLPLWIL